MSIRSLVVGVSVAATLAAAAPAQQNAPNPATELPAGLAQVIRDFDRTAAAAVKNPADISYALGVVTRDGLAWSGSYGFTDAGRQSVATADTAYHAGTSALTSIMLLQLMHDGIVHLSDQVTTYVPEIASVRRPYPRASSVSLMQLATHTSGLSLDEADVRAAAGVSAGSWEARLIAALPYATYSFEPGTHAEASRLNDGLLALALSRAAHQTYADYVVARILRPLGMTHSTLLDAGPGMVSPVLVTTLGDLARLAHLALLAGPDSVLAARDIQENYRRSWVVNSVAVPNPSEGFGVGFEGETWTSNRLAHYYFILPVGNTDPGYDAALWFEPRTHAGVILLHHGSGSALGQLIHSYVYTLNAQPIDAGRQEPVTPLPYSELAVTYDNSGAGITLAGTLTVPEGKGPFPAVLLIAKSGAFDRDESLLNHRPFLVLADYLTRHGIAVLRGDGRGIGKSGGKRSGQPDDATTDADAALAFLKTRPEIDQRNIGVISHGEAGLLVPGLAARHRELAFVVMLGAPAVPAADNQVEASRLTAESNGTLPAQAAAQAADGRRLYAMIRDERDPAALEESLREYLTGKLPEAQISAQVRQWMTETFKRQLFDDPAEGMKTLTCPVLALYGEKDLSVPASLNLPAARAALVTGNRQENEVVLVPDVNMLFQTADVGIGREANWAEETMAPSVLTHIADWIAQHKH